VWWISRDHPERRSITTRGFQRVLSNDARDSCAEAQIKIARIYPSGFPKSTLGKRRRTRQNTAILSLSARSFGRPPRGSARLKPFAMRRRVRS
jgi:hypothetical protein